MSQELKFYLHRTRLNQQMATFTKVKDNLILKIQRKFMNGIDIAESIQKRVILNLNKEILIKNILPEDELGRAESEI